jgi:hypothetical protein
MKKLILLTALIALQSCGTYCGAQKFRNSGRYYGVTDVQDIDVCYGD